ncbi:MAG: MBL fold metallo-hydrolase [Bacteroidetes bacterium]|nr:MBL fold metallo-hydrolase [Bacteroidota bacterium]
MIVEQLYTGCLAQAAYYIESNGEAAVIDPLRDIEAYTQKAKQNNAVIKYVFETHFHADFVSGHVDLAKQTGAQIVYGPTAKPGFDALVAADEQVFKLGNVSIKLLHTPGHTLESCCYLLIDEAGEEKILFSGDTIFLGDVGRPDLAQKAANMTQEELAGMLYDSIQTKIMPLADSIVVYPAHGAGSACGKNMSADKFDNLGHQKQTNYAMRKGISREEFITEVLTGLVKPPQYFPFNVAMNKQGYKNIDEVIKRGLTPLSVEAFEVAAEETEALILDTRSEKLFVKGFVPGAINIGLGGDFAPWVGTLITNIEQPILFIAERGKEKEVITRLARVGYNNTIGYLDGGLEEWQMAGKPVNTIKSITPDELADTLEEHPTAMLLDVRRKSEYDSQHIIGAESVPLDTINETMGQLDKETTYLVHCAAGYRSVIFISILMARGYNNFVNVEGGFNAILANGRFNTSHYEKPITML